MGATSFTNFCRLCAEESDTGVFIYDDAGEKRNLAAKIKTCLTIQVSQEDPFPKKVCPRCCTRLDASYLFSSATVKAQMKLRMLLISHGLLSSASLSTLQEVKREVDTDAGTLVECVLTEDKKQGPTNTHSVTPSSIGTPSGLGTSHEQKVHPGRTRKSPEHYRPMPVLRKKSKRKQKLPQKHKKSETDKVVTDLEPGEVVDDEGGDISADDDVNDGDFKATEDDSEAFSGGDCEDDDDTSTCKKVTRPTNSHSKSPWLCVDCPEIFSHVKELIIHHKEIHKQSPSFKCNECEKIINKYHPYCIHMRRHRSKKRFKCSECGRVFPENRLLVSHQVSHSDQRPYECEECGKMFKRPSSLNLHKKQHLPDNLKYRYHCDSCGKMFITKTNLDVHQKTHTGEKLFTCEMCGKRFSTKGNLDSHMLTHTKERPFTCDVCGRGFKSQREVKRHKKIHTDELPFQCSVCGRNFREKSTLLEHERIHTGELPYVCDFCGKCFRLQGTLRVHRRLHTGERPYSCQECRKEFTNWPNYNKHMKRRHGYGVGRNDKPRSPQLQFQPQPQLQQQHQSQLQSPPQPQSQPLPAKQEHDEDDSISQPVYAAPAVTVPQTSSPPVREMNVVPSVYHSCDLSKDEERMRQVLFDGQRMAQSGYALRKPPNIFQPREDITVDGRVAHVPQERPSPVFHTGDHGRDCARVCHPPVSPSVHEHRNDERSQFTALFPAVDHQTSQEERLVREVFRPAETNRYPLSLISAPREDDRNGRQYIPPPQTAPHNFYMGPSLQ